MEFLCSEVLIRGFTGGRGTGKSWCGAYDLFCRLKPRMLYMVAAPTYRMLQDSTMRSFFEVAEKLHKKITLQKTDLIARTETGAEILFRSGEDPERFRGPNLSGVWIDEASQIVRLGYEILLASLRQDGKMGWMCLGGEEELFDPVDGRLKRLDTIKDFFHVHALNQKTGRRVVATAMQPFKKGVAPLYRFHLSNGRSFVAPLHHRVLAYEDVAGEPGNKRRIGCNRFRGQCEFATTQGLHTSIGGCSNYVWLPLWKCVPIPPACRGQDVRQSPGSSVDLARTKSSFVRLASLSSQTLTITSCEYVRTDWYYDLTVPLYANYEHCQLLHHNSATFTPRGKQHWTYEVFGSGAPDTSLVRARTSENPFLPEKFYEIIKGQYSQAFAAQELEGEFVEGFGTMFQRQWFEILEEVPADMEQVVRAWDLAASEPRKGRDPDYTAGVKMGKKAGIYYILDVRTARLNPAGVEALIKQTADDDGRQVHIWMEREGGASGKSTIAYYTRVLAGYTFHEDLPSGSKAERANPLAAQAGAGHPGYGNVKILRAPWNKEFLDQVECFPLGSHDDIIDAGSICFSKLTSKGWRKINAW